MNAPKLPFRLDESRNPGPIYFDGNGYINACNSREHAAMVVERVNAYDSLVTERDALREALEHIYELPIGHTTKDSQHDLAAVIRIARAALAGDGGKQ